MGISSSAFSYGLPSTGAEEYFLLETGDKTINLLARPGSPGCDIIKFDGDKPDGGLPWFKVRSRLSHNKHVRRYQLYSAEEEYPLGHMEKVETHLRTKPGEFVKVEVWKLTTNAMVKEQRCDGIARRGMFFNTSAQRPTPSTKNMHQMGISIATQGKIKEKKMKGPAARVAASQLDLDKQRWVQTIGCEDRRYQLSVQPDAKNFHKRERDMKHLRIYIGHRKVCDAKKVWFGTSPSSYDQPYLGIQINVDTIPNVTPPQEPESGSLSHHEGDPERTITESVSGLMLILLCLAWSESTIEPEWDSSTQRFMNAMRKVADSPGSAEEMGISVSWNTTDVAARLLHLPYAWLHTWAEEDLEDPEEATTTVIPT